MEDSGGCGKAAYHQVVHLKYLIVAEVARTSLASRHEKEMQCSSQRRWSNAKHCIEVVKGKALH
jgi:hypothetical protein